MPDFSSEVLREAIAQGLTAKDVAKLLVGSVALANSDEASSTDKRTTLKAVWEVIKGSRLDPKEPEESFEERAERIRKAAER